MKRRNIRKKIKGYWFNYRYKDRQFRRIFRDKKDLLQLYNAINNTSYTNADDLVITTLEDSIILSMKNDLSFIISSEMNLYEHQSSFNPNMPIRGVFYFSRLYEVYIAHHNLDIYGSKLIKLPTPQYIIFYNGDIEKPDRMVLKLSDAFQKSTVNGEDFPALECNAIMLNINHGHNEELLNKCKRLKDYSIFTTKIKDYIKTCNSIEEAINKAIDECIEEGVLMDILYKQRTLAKNTLLTEYDEKKRRKLDRIEGYEDGLASSILILLKERGDIPINIEEKIKEEYNLERLSSWVVIASEVETVDEFCEKTGLI